MSHHVLAFFACIQISDIRERHYEKMGIGSSYLFRLDDGYVVSRARKLFATSEDD